MTMPPGGQPGNWNPGGYGQPPAGDYQGGYPGGYYPQQPPSGGFPEQGYPQGYPQLDHQQQGPPPTPYGGFPEQGWVPPPPRNKDKTGLIVALVIGTVVLLGVATVLVLNPFSSKSSTATASGGGGTNQGPVVTGGSDDTTSYPSYTTETTTTTQTPVARVDQCVAVVGSDDSVDLTQGSCSDNSGPYRVTDVLTSGETCKSDVPWASVDGYMYCMAFNPIEQYCYTSFRSDDWIQPAKCKTSGTEHIIDIVRGASNGDGCTTAYQWNRWYSFPESNLVTCVMEY